LDVRPQAAAFNPGWTAECEALKEFTDVRKIQKSLKAKGVSLAGACPERSRMGGR